MNVAVLKRIERLNYVLAGVVIIAGALLGNRPQAFGIVVGALLSAGNFTIMRIIVQRWMRAAPGQRGPQAFFMAPKMAALLVLIYLACRFLPISPTGVAIGFSIFLVSIAVETIRLTTSPPADGPESSNDSN